MISQAVLILTLSAWSVLGCPENPVPPCTCRTIGFHAAIITCLGVTSEVQLEKSLQSMKTTQVPIRNIDIVDSEINFFPSKVFKGLPAKRLFIAGITMRSLSDTDTAFEGLEDSLEELVLVQCEIFGGWDWTQLRNLRSLKNLEMRGVGMMHVDKDVKAISHLDIRNLLLTSDAISHIEDNAFATFRNLESLSLKRNQITELKRSMFPDPAPNFGQIILSNNEIEFLPKDMFTNMPKMNSILLGDNKLLTIDEDVFKPVWRQLTRIDLSGNPVRCDCRMKWMLKVPFPRTTWLKCKKPTNLEGVEIQNVAEKDLWC